MVNELEIKELPWVAKLGERGRVCEGGESQVPWLARGGGEKVYGKEWHTMVGSSWGREKESMREGEWGCHERLGNGREVEKKGFVWHHN